MEALFKKAPVLPEHSPLLLALIGSSLDQSTQNRVLNLCDPKSPSSFFSITPEQILETFCEKEEESVADSIVDLQASLAREEWAGKRFFERSGSDSFEKEKWFTLANKEIPSKEEMADYGNRLCTNSFINEIKEIKVERSTTTFIICRALSRVAYGSTEHHDIVNWGKEFQEFFQRASLAAVANIDMRTDDEAAFWICSFIRNSSYSPHTKAKVHFFSTPVVRDALVRAASLAKREKTRSRFCCALSNVISEQNPISCEIFSDASLVSALVECAKLKAIDRETALADRAEFFSYFPAVILNFLYLHQNQQVHVSQPTGLYASSHSSSSESFLVKFRTPDLMSALLKVKDDTDEALEELDNVEDRRVREDLFSSEYWCEQVFNQLFKSS